MPAGFTLYRSSGDVQIDDQYRVMSLKEIQVINVSVPGANNVFVPISATGSHVLVAPRPTTLAVTCHVYARSGTTWNGIFRFYSPDGPAAENVPFYVFSEQEPSASNAGLQVFNAAGELCFDALSARPIKINGVVAGNSGFTGASGRIYAPIILNRYEDITFNNGVIWNQRKGFYRCGGNAITPHISIVATGPIRRGTTGSYLAVDVTNY